MVDIFVLKKEALNDPMFDLGKHGHILDKNGEVKEMSGVKMAVPLLEISSDVLHQMSDFVDDMDGTVAHPNVTIVVKEKFNNTPAKIGIFTWESL